MFYPTLDVLICLFLNSVDGKCTEVASFKDNNLEAPVWRAICIPNKKRSCFNRVVFSYRRVKSDMDRCLDTSWMGSNAVLLYVRKPEGNLPAGKSMCAYVFCIYYVWQSVCSYIISQYTIHSHESKITYITYIYTNYTYIYIHIYTCAVYSMHP